MGLFTKFEPKRSHILRRDENIKTSSTDHLQPNSALVEPTKRERSRTPTSRSRTRLPTAGTGLNMNGVSLVSDKKQRPALSTRQPTTLKVIAVESLDPDVSDDSSADSRRSQDSQDRSGVSSVTSKQSSEYHRDMKPKIIDVSTKGSSEAYNPYNYGNGYPSVPPPKARSYRVDNRNRSRSRPRHQQFGDDGPEVCGGPSYPHQQALPWQTSSSSYNNSGRSMSMRNSPPHSRPQMSSSQRQHNRQSSYRSMPDHDMSPHRGHGQYGYQNGNNNYRSNDYAHNSNNRQQKRDFYRGRSPPALQEYDEPSRLSTGTKMDLAYQAGYKDAVERAKADFLKQFNQN